MVPDPGFFNDIFTTVDYGHIPHGRVVFNEFNLHVRPPGTTCFGLLYDIQKIHMRDLGGGLRSTSASVAVTLEALTQYYLIATKNSPNTMKTDEKHSEWKKHACQLANLQDLEIIDGSGAVWAAVERQAVSGGRTAAAAGTRSVMGLQRGGGGGAVSSTLVLERQHRATTAIHHRHDRLQYLQQPTRRHIQLHVIIIIIIMDAYGPYL